MYISFTCILEFSNVKLTIFLKQNDAFDNIELMDRKRIDKDNLFEIYVIIVSSVTSHCNRNCNLLVVVYKVILIAICSC